MFNLYMYKLLRRLYWHLTNKLYIYIFFRQTVIFANFQRLKIKMHFFDTLNNQIVKLTNYMKINLLDYFVMW